MTILKPEELAQKQHNGSVHGGLESRRLRTTVDEEALRACNLGYRSRYIKNTVNSVLSGEADLEKIKGMCYQEARKELMKLSGVGEKVADCICLFALHHLEAFPA